MLSNSCRTYLLSKALSPRQSKSAEGSCFFILLSHFSITANTTSLNSVFAMRSYFLQHDSTFTHLFEATP